jgi:hypothetical protein
MIHARRKTCCDSSLLKMGSLFQPSHRKKQERCQLGPCLQSLYETQDERAQLQKICRGCMVLSASDLEVETWRQALATLSRLVSPCSETLLRVDPLGDRTAGPGPARPRMTYAWRPMDGGMDAKRSCRKDQRDRVPSTIQAAYQVDRNCCEILSTRCWGGLCHVGVRAIPCWY